MRKFVDIDAPGVEFHTRSVYILFGLLTSFGDATDGGYHAFRFLQDCACHPIEGRIKKSKRQSHSRVMRMCVDVTVLHRFVPSATTTPCNVACHVSPTESG